MTNANYQEWKQNEQNERAEGKGTMEHALKCVRIVLRNGLKTGNSFFINLYRESYRQPITSPDVLDLLSVATVAIIEHSQDDFDTMQKHVFKAINAYVWQARKPYDGTTLYIEDERHKIHNIPSEMSAIVNDKQEAEHTELKAILETLTPRQKKIALLLAKGFSYRQIADNLGVKSVSTIAEHVQAIRKKAAKIIEK